MSNKYVEVPEAIGGYSYSLRQEPEGSVYFDESPHAWFYSSEKMSDEEMDRRRMSYRQDKIKEGYISQNGNKHLICRDCGIGLEIWCVPPNGRGYNCPECGKSGYEVGK
jgi:hypothetical protein